MDRNPTLELREESELRARIERQDRALAEQQRELRDLRNQLDPQDRALREACDVLALILKSRVYWLMRALGRWGWLERRIRRVLR